MLCVTFVQLGGARTCGESWLTVKDSLTHRPSSQGWASLAPLIDYWPVFTSVCCMFYLCELVCPIFAWLVKSMSCLSGLCTVCLVCLVCVLCVLFVWSVYCVSCLSGLGVICLVCLGCLSFLPTSYSVL